MNMKQIMGWVTIQNAIIFFNFFYFISGSQKIGVSLLNLRFSQCWLWRALFVIVRQCGRMEVNCRFGRTCSAFSWAGGCFNHLDPEYGDNTYLRNVVWLLLDHTAHISEYGTLQCRFVLGMCFNLQIKNNYSLST